MDKILIRGGKALSGAVRISGSKNAALPLMCASLLSSGRVTLSNMPELADIHTLTGVLTHLGMEKEGNGADTDTLTLNAARASKTTAPYDLVRKMRASILVLGPLLAREGRARVSLPGGCAIGNRPIDLHLRGLQKLGADIDLADGYVEARAKRLHGARIRIPSVSVGATENLLMAAVLAKGESVIENAAREPEVADLARFLVRLGAKISGIGTEELRIEGVSELSGGEYAVMADRIEAGSYAVAGAITGGDIRLDNVPAGAMGATLDVLRDMNVTVREHENSLSVSREGPLAPVEVSTAPYPGFATDMQAQVMALACLAQGASVITETIFENRFMHVPELSRMGADIRVNGNVATVRGPAHLKAAPVMATDLRASMSLVLAGLAAEGETTVRRVYHLDRGYEKLEQKLTALGADIRREKE